MIREKIITIRGVDYIVSEDGHVFSTKNVGRGKFHKELTQRENKDGYMCVTVGKNSNRRSERVHRIVAKAFIPNPYGLPEVDHIDNDKKNNNVTNLQWISGFDNKSKIPFAQRSRSHSGELNGRAILTVQDVINIRKMFASGASQYSIAKQYKCGWSTIHNIVIRNTWEGVADVS